MTLYDFLLYTELVAAPLIFISLLLISAPYGRHSRRGWGPKMNSRWAWILMELPAVITIAAIFMLHKSEIHWSAIIFLLIWEFHYLYRTFYFPLQLRKVNYNFPVLLVLFAVIFNFINGFINGTYLFNMNPPNSTEFLGHPHFWLGLTIFISGFIMHFRSDRIILRLRDNTEETYSIPKGGMFRYVTNPNYLGEFVQWTGWAILTWSVAGAAFALFTLANLLPRAISNHRWYHEKFSQYPSSRKIFFPFIY